MRPVFCILFSIILLFGCKKESDPDPDYACECQPNGKNILSLIIHQATALFPYENENHRWGFIDLSGNFVIEPQFEDVQIGFCGGLAPVMKNSRWGYIDRSGSFIITPQFNDADIFYCDLAKVWFINGTVGYINKSGGIVYRSAQTLKEKPNFTKIADALSKYNIQVGYE